MSNTDNQLGDLIEESSISLGIDRTAIGAGSAENEVRLLDHIIYRSIWTVPRINFISS